jgi:hypothetical protein
MFAHEQKIMIIIDILFSLQQEIMIMLVHKI